MRHFLLKAMLPLVMAIASSVSAFAENVVYGIVPSSSFGGKTTSFDIDAVNADEKLAITTDLDLTGVDGVKCAASVRQSHFHWVFAIRPSTVCFSPRHIPNRRYCRR